MNIQQIIDQADILVPNELSVADKALYLNAVNQDFFNVVKIPKVERFDCITAQSNYVLSSDIRQKNIDKVLVGMYQYQSFDSEDVTPAQNAYMFDDTTHTISLYPAPYDNLGGFLRYQRIATTTFLSSNLTVSPDAPEEYHWTYVPALAAHIAHSQDDSVKAGNYENQYKSAWNVAAQNYQGG